MTPAQNDIDINIVYKPSQDEDDRLARIIQILLKSIEKNK